MINLAKFNSKRFLSRTQVYVKYLNPRTTEEHLKNYRLFKNAKEFELNEVLNKNTGKVRHIGAVITFETEAEKQECLIDSLYFSKNSMHQASMLPVSELDWMSDPEYFYTVHAHRPFDLSIVNNICKEVTEEDLMGLDIEGLEEVRLFSNEEKHSSNNKNVVELKQWAHFYFTDNQTRSKFENECKNKQHIINDFNLVARQAAQTIGSKGSPSLVGQSRVTMTSGKRM